MNPLGHPATSAGATTLPAARVRSFPALAVLLALSSFLLPAAAHRLGLPVRWLLPMHWAVLLAGLSYGGIAGAATGLLAPFLSFVVSGMPLPHILPAMTLELATYGALAGFARQRWALPGWVAATVAIAGGRVVFMAMALATGAATPTVPAYLRAALLPGLPVALLQIALLPPLASWWVRRERERE